MELSIRSLVREPELKMEKREKKRERGEKKDRGEKKLRQRVQTATPHAEQLTIVKYQTPGHFGRLKKSDETAEFEGLTSEQHS